MFLKSVDPNLGKELWDIFSKDLTQLPHTWPKLKQRFIAWIENSKTDSYPKRFLVLDSEEVALKNIMGFVSADLVDDSNESDFMLAKSGDVNISYMTRPEFGGKGVSTFSLSEVTKLVLEEGYNPVLRIASWNETSIKVAEKCGFIQSGADIVIQDTFDYEPTLLKVFRLS